MIELNRLIIYSACTIPAPVPDFHLRRLDASRYTAALFSAEKCPVPLCRESGLQQLVLSACHWSRGRQDFSRRTWSVFVIEEIDSMESHPGVKRDLKKSRWRHRLIPGRSGAMPRPFCADDGRSAATHRHTAITDEFIASENVEKNSSNRVNSRNKWCVFR